jgi:hypothetical protein
VRVEVELQLLIRVVDAPVQRDAQGAGRSHSTGRHGSE